MQGDSGLLAGLEEGKIWIDHSTTDYEQEPDTLYTGYIADRRRSEMSLARLSDTADVTL